jgi:hypothetical protein
MSTICTWKTDGSSACQQADFTVPEQTDNDDIQNDGFTRVTMVTTGGSPVNLIGIIPTAAPSSPPSLSASSSYWFQVQIVELDRSSSLSIGITSLSQFQQGYKNKGMYYNGNLTNGSAALETSYGPYLQGGDYCTIHCTHTTTHHQGEDNKAGTVPTTVVTMTVYMNGKKIGKAFEVVLDDTGDDGRFFYPSFAVHGTVSVRTKVGTNMPDTLLSGQGTDGSTFKDHPLEGVYDIIQATDATGSRSILPIVLEDSSLEDHKAVMTVATDRSTMTPATATLQLSVRLVNSIMMRTVCTTVEDHDTTTTKFDVSDNGISNGHLPMTMMLAPPPYDGIERELVQSMRGQWKTLQFVNNNNNNEDDNQKSLLQILNTNGDIVAQCVRQQSSSDDTAALTQY